MVAVCEPSSVNMVAECEPSSVNMVAVCEPSSVNIHCFRGKRIREEQDDTCHMYVCSKMRKYSFDIFTCLIFVVQANHKIFLITKMSQSLV